MSGSPDEKGIIWFSDGRGQVFKGHLLKYDSREGIFWVRSSRDCPSQVDVVVILKDGSVFPSGKCEWCGKTRLVHKERIPDTHEGNFLLRLESSV